MDATGNASKNFTLQATTHFKLLLVTTDPNVNTSIYPICQKELTDSVTVTVISTPDADIAGSTTICYDENATISFTGTPNAKVTYTDNLNGTIATKNITLDDFGKAHIDLTEMKKNTTFNLVSIQTAALNGVVCNKILTKNPVLITIAPRPTATISGTQTVCENTSATISFTGTKNAKLIYQIDENPQETIDLVTGTNSITIPNLKTNTAVHLISVISNNLTKPVCTTPLNQSAYITVIKTPEAVVIGSKTICQNDSASFTFSGTPNAQLTYNLTGIGTETITLDNFGNASRSITNIQNNTTCTLNSITTAAKNGVTCTQNLTNSAQNSATILMVPTPFATISGSNTFCQGENGSILFTGTPNSVVTYNIDNEENKTINIDATGNATIQTELQNLQKSLKYNLISVAVKDATNTVTCEKNLSKTAKNTVEITVIPTPFAKIEGEATVCQNSDVTLSFTGTPNATIEYQSDDNVTRSINNFSITLDPTGQKKILIKNIQKTTQYSLTSVKTAAVNGKSCTADLSNEKIVKITVISTPTATLSGSTTVCEDSDVSLPITNGTPNSTVTYTINTTEKHTIDLNDSGENTIFIKNIKKSQKIELVSIKTPSIDGINCEQFLTQIATVTVNAKTIPHFKQMAPICYNGEFKELPTTSLNGIRGSWSPAINNLERTTYTFTPNAAECATTQTMTVDVLPNMEVPMTGGQVCINADTNTLTQGYDFIVNLNPADYTFAWFLNDALINNETNNKYTAVLAGDYSVTVRNKNTGCSFPSNVAQVSNSYFSENITIDTSVYFADNASITVNPNQNTGDLYFQLDAQAPQTSNQFNNVSYGPHNVRVFDTQGCLDLTIPVYIIGYPHFFSPNNDGVNDYWNIFYDASLQNVKTEIYDRYGKLLNIIHMGEAGWDGSFNGEPAPASDYWFKTMYYLNGKLEVFKAHFSLVR